jgi:hypothetical protein
MKYHKMLPADFQLRKFGHSIVCFNRHF